MGEKHLLATHWTKVNIQNTHRTQLDSKRTNDQAKSGPNDPTRYFSKEDVEVAQTTYTHNIYTCG
jgi:hypothetical protein